MLNKLKELLTEVSAGRWKKVLRGPVNWAAFPFSQYDTAVAVFMDESTLLRRKNHGLVTLEFMMAMPAGIDEPNDDMLDLMRSDAAAVFEALAGCELRDPQEPDLPLVYMVDNTTDSTAEVSDVDLKIQGLIATVSVQF